jgi:hypothetical protein
MRRALETGRHVSIPYVRDCVGRSRRALDAALTAGAPIMHWVVVDTASADGTPRVIDGSGHFGGSGDTLRYWSAA